MIVTKDIAELRWHAADEFLSAFFVAAETSSENKASEREVSDQIAHHKVTARRAIL